MSLRPGIAINRLRLRTLHTAEAVVIRCTGRLTSDYTQDLRDEFLRVLPGAKRIVLDLSNLRHMDSSGLGTLVRLYLSAKTANCELELVNLSQRIKTLLGLTNLLSVFSACGQYLTRIP
jgi:anti-anti-sigma factor